MNRFIQGIQNFQRDVYPVHRELFERLASGQNPEALFIACSDSRVSLEWLTQTGPGDLFVCRNAGNIAPKHGETDAVTAAIEYAVAALEVKDIVIKGHSDCGAMKGLMNLAALEGMPEVRNWLRHSEEARRTFERANIDPKSPMALETLNKLNIRLQLENLRTHPKVRTALRAGTLSLHGWYYDIQSGTVQAWDADGSQWVAVNEAYKPIAARREEPIEEARHA